MKPEKIVDFLLSSSMSKAERGGTFCTAKAGGIGFASQEVIRATEKDLRDGGAVWVKVSMKETGFGDRLRVSAIFKEDIAEMQKIVVDLRKAREESAPVRIKKCSDGTVEFWKGALMLLYRGPRKRTFEWGKPANLSRRPYDPEEPRYWFTRATLEVWRQVGYEPPADTIEK